ncbi:MAG: hypothetical protein PHW62_06020 [Candidatus Ratteibacteria bacterium]|nr:hypothetical protein [Candidatus Ratteibacteria bacterium]
MKINLTDEQLDALTIIINIHLRNCAYPPSWSDNALNDIFKQATGKNHHFWAKMNNEESK